MKKKVQFPHLYKPTTIYIQRTFFNNGEEVVVYKRYAKARGLWVEEMCYKHELDSYEV